MTEPLHVDEVPAEEPVGPEAFDVADDDALAALDLIAEKPEPWRRWLAWLFRRPEPVAEDVADPLDELVDRIAAGGPQALVEVFAEVGRLLRATPAQQPGSLVPPWPWTPEQRAQLNAVLWEGERRRSSDGWRR